MQVVGIWFEEFAPRLAGFVVDDAEGAVGELVDAVELGGEGVFAGVGVGSVDLLLDEEDVGGPAEHEGVSAGELGGDLGEECGLAGEGAWGGGQEQVAGDFVQHVQGWACVALGVGVLAELAEAFHGFVDQVAYGEFGGGWLFEAEFVSAVVTGWAAEVSVEFGEGEVQRGCAFAGTGGWCGRG